MILGVDMGRGPVRLTSTMKSNLFNSHVVSIHTQLDSLASGGDDLDRMRIGHAIESSTVTLNQLHAEQGQTVVALIDLLKRAVSDLDEYAGERRTVSPLAAEIEAKLATL